MAAAKLSIQSQIAAAEYAGECLKKWHRHAVNARLQKQDIADLQEAHFAYVISTLRWFERNSATIRAALEPLEAKAEEPHEPDPA